MVGNSQRIRWSSIAAMTLSLTAATPAQAVAPPPEAKQGLSLAQRGECKAAVPLLETAEKKHSSPTTAVALANCLVKMGDLARAYELYTAAAQAKPASDWTASDKLSQKAAAERGSKLEKRLGTIRLKPADKYEDLVVTIDGRTIENPLSPFRVRAGRKLHLRAEAKGHETFDIDLTLREGETQGVPLPLNTKKKKPTGGNPMVESGLPESAEDESPPAATARRKRGPSIWLGAEYRGYVIPTFAVNILGDGGKTIFVPGAAVSLTRSWSRYDVAFGISYASFKVSDMPFKAKSAPKTDYELIDSDLQTLQAALELYFRTPLDDRGRWQLRVGAGAGIGWTFLGDLKRTQAYFQDEGDTNTDHLQKCIGPNNPPGTFRFCNELDADFNHYDGYREPNWSRGGYRPLIYPWLAIPEIGITWRASRTVAIDLQTALSISGIMTGLGVRYGL